MADHRPGARSAGRHPDALLADVGHDLSDGEEVRVVVQLGDHGEFFVQPVERGAVAVQAAPGHARLALPAQQLCRAARPGPGAEHFRLREVRRAQAQIRRGVNGAHGRRGGGVPQQTARPPGSRSRAFGDQPRDARHRPLVLEPALPAVQAAPVDGPQQPRGVQDIGEPVLVGVGVADGVGEHGGGAGTVGQRQGPGGHPKRSRPGAGPFMQDGLQPYPPAEDLPPRRQQLHRDVLPARRQRAYRLRERPEQHDQTGATVLAQRLPRHHRRRPAHGPGVRGRRDAAQPRPAGPVLCKQHEPQGRLDDVRATAHRRAAPRRRKRRQRSKSLDGQIDTEDRPDTGPGACLREPHRSCDRVPVGERERRHAALGRPPDKVLGVGGAIASGVSGRHVQMREARHSAPPSSTPFQPYARYLYRTSVRLL